ncbi:MAG: hypothetical protein FWD31_01410 [Planctomycetaceae bacterium]|nr:hypothetical protein [Planctomycetaceae bacterium]
MKHYILGTDEAGYGPNLGPLAICCVVWEMTADTTENSPERQPIDDHLAELERRLATIVANTPAELKKSGKLLLIGDSKKLYQSGKLQILANSVLLPVYLTGQRPEKLSHLLSQYDCDSHRSAAERVKGSLCPLGISLCDIKAKMISPRDFNRLLGQWGNKSTVLTDATLSLIKNTIQSLPDCGDVTILCDKHGGRNRYVDMIYQFFPDDGWIEILTEGTALSVYRLNAKGRKIEFRFQAKADRHIPAALASMTAKLLREISMVEFNRFWQQHLPDLQATAGYPVDALRFFGQIEETRQSLGIPKSDLWREK